MFDDGRTLALLVVAGLGAASAMHGGSRAATRGGEELVVTLKVPYEDFMRDEIDVLVEVTDWGSVYPRWRYVNPRDFEMGRDRQISKQLFEEKLLRATLPKRGV